MGNGITKNPCFPGNPHAATVTSDPPRDDSVGHSFAYVPSADHPPPLAATMSESSFFSLSGAAISANLATSASMSSFRMFDEMTWPPPSACTFESTRSFAAEPLQAAPPRLSMSGSLQLMSGRFSETSGAASTLSGRLSDGPFMSGPLSNSSEKLQSSVPETIAERRAERSRRRNEQSLLRFFARTSSSLRFRGSQRYARRTNEPDEPTKVSVSDGDYRSPPNGNVEWAQGTAGEDRFHVAISDEHGWVFVGIYDGFGGPDAADYLFANLYVAVHDELKGVLWDDIRGGHQEPAPDNVQDLFLDQPADVGSADAKISGRESRNAGVMHRDVLRALARALKKTEEAFFEAAEQLAEESPELGLVGSCVLVMLMKGKDVYVMNVGDSRAVLARRSEPDLEILGRAAQDLQHFRAEVMCAFQVHDEYGLQTVQLTPEHSAAVEEEVKRIKSQHPNDRYAVVNRRVKGKLSVTRAFGAGYLKQPKWNNRLLGVFKVNYVGTDPYVSSTPSLCHHRIASDDKFLVLSSDGLYQYFTNKEVVDLVESYISKDPEGDPAKHLLSELVIRAARKAGMAWYELLEIPQGQRRNYHDDVCVIVISFDGGIWRCSV